MRNISKLTILAFSAVTSVSAFAGDLSADIAYNLQTGGVNFHWIYSGGQQSIGTAQFLGTRTGGTDTIVPGMFPAYCVEVGENVAPGANYWTDVTYLLGSTTNSGGSTGPVFFDATRTANLETLWGSFFSLIGGDSDLSAAFQLAQWEITFDDDMTLTNPNGRMWCEAGDFQPGITNAAEIALTAIRTGQATTRQQLALISKEGLQDLVTPVPEPASLAAVGLGFALLLRRKKKQA